MIPRALIFIFTLYLAKLLGSIEYGKFDYSLSFGYLIGVFFELGGNIILTKYVARGYYSTFYYSFKFRLFSIVLTFIVVFSILFIFKLHQDILIHIFFASIGIAFSSLMNLYFAFFRGVQKMNYEAIVLVIQKIIFIGVCLILILNSKNASSVLLSFAFSMIISWLIIQGIFIKKKKEYIETDNKYAIVFKDYMKDIMSLALVEVFSIIYFRATQIILEAFAGYQAVGVYGVSYKLVEAFINIPSILMIVFFPGFAKLATENISEFKIQFKSVFSLLIVLGIVSSAICWFFGKFLFALIGKDYGESYIIVRYMTIAMTMIFPNFLLTHSLIALDQNIRYAGVLFFALILNILISIIIVPIYKEYGSAISVGICEIIIFISCYILTKKSIRELERAKT